MQVALVEDDEPVRRALRRLLLAANFQVQAFASGRAFLESLAAGVPDCLLLDVNMPEMSGPDVLEALRQRSLHLPTIILTGSGDSLAESMAGSVYAHLRKPVDHKLLLRAIEGAAGLRAKR